MRKQQWRIASGRGGGRGTVLSMASRYPPRIGVRSGVATGLTEAAWNEGSCGVA